MAITFRTSSVLDLLKVLTFCLFVGIAYIVTIIVIVLFFPTWILLFILSLPFKKIRRKVNRFFLESLEYIKYGPWEIYSENEIRDFPSYIPESVIKYHEKRRISKEKWDNNWSLFKKHFVFKN